MIVQRYLKLTSYLLWSGLLFMASCADDSLVDFSDRNNSGEQNAEYEFCTDEATFDSDKALAASDLVGEYTKSSELVCGVAGCEEVPTVNVQFVGTMPSFTLTEDGEILNPDGAFEEFESWTLLPPDDTELPSRLELTDFDEVENNFQVTILEVGPCRLRLENNQGWIEYVRLEKL